MKKFLPASSITRFLAALSPFGEVHGPVLNDDGVLILGRIESPATLRLDYQRTLLPPKKYLLPPQETVLTYSPDTSYRQSLPAQNYVLFGLHPCDLAGIAYLDKAFAAAGPDPLYQARRRNLTLIGISCEPDEYCFCTEVGAAAPPIFDLYMHHAPDGFHIETGSLRGDEIFAEVSSFLEEGEGFAAALFPCDIEGDIWATAKRDETFPDSHLWDDFAARCLSCGACSLCCPTCYCFDVRESADLNGETAQRRREWDNCLFMGFGEVAGGFNFRKSRRERFQYRYQHKYLGFGPVRGIVACVGCGRCREVCPVRIDLLELFKGDSHESRP